jgi:hypothetical protein
MPNPTNRSTTRTLQWLATYGEYVTYVEAMGRLPRESTSSAAQPSVEVRLASWARYQRRRLARDVMPGWQRELLEMVPGFDWDPTAEQWQRRCEELGQFLAAHRRMPRYRSPDPVERRLAAWVHKQRHRAKQDLLSHSRVEALRRLPFRIL